MAELYDDWFRKERNEPYAVGSIVGSLPFLKIIPPSKKRVLVIGCGDGYEAGYLKDQDHIVIGITTNKKEVEVARKKFGVEARVADMHKMPTSLGKFDVIFASNVLEHSPMPYLALLHWRKFLKKNGWLILGMPSREWLSEYYHHAVLNRPQIKDLLHKTGFELLAGPQMKPMVDLRGGDIYYDMGRLWGFSDGYVARMVSLPREKKMLGVGLLEKKKGNILRTLLKWPFNKARNWYARNYREW